MIHAYRRIAQRAQTWVRAQRRDPTLTSLGARVGFTGLSVIVGMSLVLVADSSAHFGQPTAEWFFWAGLLLIFVPIAARLISKDASDNERILTVGILALGLYLVKVIHSPSSFTFHDEFIHLRSAQDLAATGHLFHINPLLPVSPLYPGLEIVTVAVADLSGLSIFAAGIVVIGVSLLVLVLSLYLAYTVVSGSSRLAGIAALIYTANPNFLFFDGQFSYESMALAFVALALYALVRHTTTMTGWHGPVGYRRHHVAGMAPMVVLAILAVVPTHHLSSYALILLLATMAVVGWLRRNEREYDSLPLRAAALLIVVAAAWLIFVASRTIGYLSPHLVGAVREVLQYVAGQATGRELFRTTTGSVAPLWERVVAIGSVALILITMPFGLRHLWRRYSTNVPALTLGLAALSYPFSLPFRLTQSGAEASNRASEFVFIPLAFVLAAAAARVEFRPLPTWTRTALVSSWAAFIFAGGIVIGFAPWSRLPGPYQVAADTRSIEPEGVSAAVWLRQNLGPDNRIITDRTNALLMGSYGDQHPVTGFADRVQTSYVVLSLRYGKREQRILRASGARYLVLDSRLTSGLPLVGDYFEGSEPRPLGRLAPLAPQMLAKFDQLQGVSRLFDAGDIAIYDVSALLTDGAGSGHAGVVIP